VAATGFVQVTNADGILGIAGYPWMLANLGTIALLGTSGDGVHLTAGGVVTNGQTGSAGGSISAPTAGVEIDGAAGTVNNFGTIASPTPTGVGIILDAGGKIINGTSGDTAPLISGAYNGIFALSAAATIVNYGTIKAPGSIFNGGPAANIAVFLASGGTVQNGSPGSTGALIDGYHIGISSVPRGEPSTIINVGTI
jgi:hypothetical protein